MTSTFYFVCALGIVGCAVDSAPDESSMVAQDLRTVENSSPVENTGAPGGEADVLGPVTICTVLTEGGACSKWGAPGTCRSGSCCTGCFNPDSGLCNIGVGKNTCGNGGDICANCGDGNECTEDRCLDYTCVNTNPCDDGNECTRDLCPAGGCAYENVVQFCHMTPTSLGLCEEGVCTPPAP
jgi:hypothetical protein